MATIIKNLKDGKVVSYKFRAYLGKAEDGTQIAKYTTWKIPESLTPSKAERLAQKTATAWEKEVKTEYDKDLNDPARAKAKEIDKQRTDFSDFVCKTWFSLRVCDGNHKPKTIEFYHYIIETIAEYFTDSILQQITSLHIQEYIIFLRTQYKTRQGKPISNTTVRHHYRVLSLIFAFAYSQELINRNPMDKVATQEEAETFFALLPNCPLDFQCILYLFITTGMRRGELLGLQWRDINFDNLTLEIKRNITYTPECGVMVDTPKTANSIRIIPLIPAVADLLGKYQTEINPKSAQDTFLFPSEQGNDIPRDPNAITRRVKRFMRTNGLPDLSPPRFAPFLRHTSLEQRRGYQKCARNIRPCGRKHDA